jgi:phage shock protein A
MQDNLSNLRSSIIEVIALQKRAEQQYSQAQAETLKWKKRAKLALDKGNEFLAKEALRQKKHYSNTANIIKNQLEQLNNQADTLKEKLQILERKINEQTLGTIDTSTDIGAFERIEEKVRRLEYRSQIYGELDGIEIEKKLPRLDIDEIITLQKRAEQQYNKELAEILKWDRRAKLAISQVDYSLVREAFRQKDNHVNIANIIKIQIEQIKTQVDNLQKNLAIFENNITNPSSSMSAFERMEEKVMQLESRSQAYSELGGIGIEREFANNQITLPEATTVNDSAVDAELEELRSKLKEL